MKNRELIKINGTLTTYDSHEMKWTHLKFNECLHSGENYSIEVYGETFYCKKKELSSVSRASNLYCSMCVTEDERVIGRSILNLVEMIREKCFNDWIAFAKLAQKNVEVVNDLQTYLDKVRKAIKEA